MDRTGTLLPNLAAAANSWLDCAKVADDRARHARVSAGKVLAEAKERVRAGEPGHTNWAKWVRENVTHSYRDVNKCIALAKSPNPEAALIELVRQGMVRSRSKAGQTFDCAGASAVLVMPAPQSVTVEAVKRDIRMLSAADRIDVAEWLMSQNEVQRDRLGNVVDPLPVRLKRVLHRLKKKGQPRTGNFGQIIDQRNDSDLVDGLLELEQIVSELSYSWSSSLLENRPILFSYWDTHDLGKR
jgi:hypothetical protein